MSENTELPVSDGAEVLENPRSSSRERQKTEKGRQYQIELYNKTFKQGVSNWRTCVGLVTKAMSDETDVNVIRESRSKLESAHNTVSVAFSKLVDVCDEDHQMVTCITATFENLEQDFQNLMCKIADRIVDLDDNNFDRRSHISRRSSRSGSSRTSKSSAQSYQSKATVETAALKAKLKYMDAENKAKLELEKLVTLRKLEVAQAKVEAHNAWQADLNPEADHGSLELGIPEFDEQELVKAYVHTQSLAGNNAVAEEDTLPKMYAYPSPVDSKVVVNSALDPSVAPFEQNTCPRKSFDSKTNTAVHSVFNPSAVPSEHTTAQRCADKSNSDPSEVGVFELTKSLAEQLSLSRLPPPEPGIFDGDPLKYPGWKSAFHVLIDQRNIPPSERIYYLRKYLSERVREVVANYFLLGTEDAYTEAKGLLDERYGDSFVIANAFRTKLDNWPKIQPRDSKGLQRFSDFLKQCHTAMSSIGSLGALDDDRENRKLLMKLPDWLSARWNRFAVKWKEERNAFPPFKEFVIFVGREAKIACDPITSVQSLKSEDSSSKRETNDRNFRKVGTFLSGAERKPDAQAKGETPIMKTVRPPECSYCHGAHDIDTCRRFLARSMEDRKEYVKQKGWCFGCLEEGHVARRCQQRRKCAKCHKMHPTPFHGDVQKIKDGNGAIPKTDASGVSFMSSGGSYHTSSLIVPVYVSHESFPDREHLVYALLDTQSDTTFVHEDTCVALGISGVQVNLWLSTMYAENKLVPSCKIKGLKVRGVNGSVEISLPDAYTRQIIPANREHIPTREMAEKWPHLHPILDDLSPLLDCEVGLLIGYNCARALIPRAVIAPEINGPFAQKTDLGWGIVGIVDQDDQCNDSDPIGVSHRVVVCEVDSSLRKVACSGEEVAKDNVMLSFRNKVKEVFSPSDMVQMINLEFNERKGDACLSAEDRKFLEIVTDGIQRKDGCYEMPLPLKDDSVHFPINKNQALHRLNQLKRRLKGDSVFRDHYCSFMRDMINHGYAERVPVESLDRNDGKVFYIPHHGVYNPKKPGKIRVVFDCSAQFKDESLNKHLLQGPDLTNKLVGVLCRFRKERVAVLCDIEQMFFQFRVSPDNRDLLRFLWWETEDFDSEPIVFRMCVHLFGATSSPGCANFGLKQIATDFEEEFGADVANFVKRDFYVDDGITSRPSETEAMDLIVQSRNMLAKGGLRLHKFLSSSKDLLQQIPPDDRAKGFEQVDLFADSLPIERALGAQWSIESDSFQFRIILSDKPFTRRGILSTVNSVYDPLGFICPVILTGKQILQSLCADQVDWDSPIPDYLRARWEIWRNDLFNLSLVEIDRCFKPKDFGNVVTTELHHFSDASQSGYGQCSYLRLVDENRRVHCSLVMGKSRVVPLKPVTIPRLELTAALVSVKIGLLVQEELELNGVQSWYWTDSKVVLGYISNEARRFHVFVANRVQQIREHTSPGQWNHVETDHNPADIASRGAAVNELIKKRQWFNGPDFLWEPELPPRKDMPSISLEDCELKKVQTHASQAVERQFDLLDNLAYFSSWSRMKRALAVCCDYIKILRHRVRSKKLAGQSKEHCNIGNRHVEDLIQTELLIIKSVQLSAFGKEIEVLKNIQNAIEDSDHVKYSKSTLKKGSNLARLDPFLDEDGVLRVGGRLTRSRVKENVNPVILPKKGHVVDLIVRHFHEKVNHQGRGMTSNEIRSNGFWIIGLSSAVYRVVGQCTTCRRLRSAAQGQKMADLPSDRLEAVPPFTYSGVDYFGPWIIREGRKELKRYGVVFTCLCCRAIHLEISASLTTDSFINALRRFISIRGPIRELRSDRGTNFVGAERELAKAVSEMDHNKISQFLLEKGCDNFSFKMNPPSASHMGGVWERQIRSVRNILSVLMYHHGSQLDDESLRTFMCETVAIVNSRPLTTQNLNDPLSTEPLTPNHLLTMKSKLILPPPGHFGKPDLYSRKRWRRVQYLANEFWSRWRNEYLQNLQIRQKWERSSRNLVVGDVVVISDESLPRSQWSLARVVEAKVDEDNLVRKVRLLVGSSALDDKGRRHEACSYLERPIHKLVLISERE